MRLSERIPTQTEVIAGNALLTNPLFVSVNSLNLGATVTPLYTVPTGRKAIVAGYFFNNQNAGANIGYITVTRGVTTVRVSVQTSYATVQGGHNNFSNCPFIFQAGDVIGVSASATDLNIHMTIMTFDATSPYKSTLTTALAAGDNTLYTCPAGKRFRDTSGNLALQPISGVHIFYANNSGGARTTKFYHVPSGGTVIERNRLTQSTTNPTNLSATVADLSQVGVVASFDLAAGDAIVLNLDANTATQLAYITGAEYTP